ncbi:hypothetical protein Pmani_011765 [Petrolisthes manimaculis]|uniref:Ubiquitin-like domain-containing protein n=1 Tax=Petrolisthes manimaculis TaxID=1843537 RepID=A0AAE1PYS9_9EUCA|nr:hypothetical protein Pmani_011765 [Petrolisthes manimaculis]
MQESVTLIIKAANQSVPDEHMVCDSDWSVLLLKNHLSSVHPAKPRVDEQRLIYSGQLLADNLLLRNVLRHPTENNAYTIHLVCSPPRNTTQQPATNQRLPTQNPSTPSSSQRLTSTPLPANQRHTSEPPPSPASQRVPTSRPGSQNSGNMVEGGGSTQDGSTPTHSEVPPVSNEAPDGLRRRNINNSSDSTPQSIEAASAYPTQQLPLSALQASADPIQQMATMQQMYANYMAYIQYIQMGGVVAGLAWPQQMVQFPATAALPATAAATTTTTTTPTTPPPDPADVLQPPPDQNQPADPQPPQPPQQIRMNAQGGEPDDDDDDEGMGRDWLDWIYVLSRMMVLLSIVYFYSTLSRFMFVICIAMLLYLYQAGWFRPARRIDHPQPQPNNNNPGDRNNNNNNNNNDRPRNDNNTDEDTDEADEVERQEPAVSDHVVEEVPVRPSILALSWTFLTTFFTSLIPEQPQGI